jgi:hypothetical protein
MTEVLERVLSAATLRTVIRAKSQAGVSARTIAQLIAFYVPADVVAQHGGISERLAAELIPVDQRPSFFQALQRLPTARRDLSGVVHR